MRRRFGGFTIIELLIVVAIIGILVSLTIVLIGGARTKARDAQRLADVKQMQTALELYYTDVNSYPGTWTAGSALVSPTGLTFMAKRPTNPSPWVEGSCTANSDYTYSSPTSNTYSIGYCLAGVTNNLPAGTAVAIPGNINQTCTINCVGAMNLSDGCGGICPYAPSASTQEYFHMDSTSDSSGFGRNFSGFDGTYVAGKFGNAAKFTRASNNVAAFVGSLIGASGSSFTMMAWINAASHPATGAQWGIISDRGGLNSSTGRAALIFENIAGVEKLLFDAYYTVGGEVFNYKNITLDLNTWYHVAAVYDSATNKQYLYVNGVSVDSGLTTNGVLIAPAWGSAYSYVGNYYWASGIYGFDGIIDEMIVERRAWSATEVLNYYNNLK